jgi:hypothetical protein
VEQGHSKVLAKFVLSFLKKTTCMPQGNKENYVEHQGAKIEAVKVPSSSMDRQIAETLEQCWIIR